MLAKVVAVLLRYPEQIGDHHRRERLAIVDDQLTMPAAQEHIQAGVGQAGHFGFIFLEPLRSHQPPQQTSLGLMLRPVLGHHELVEHPMVTVVLHLLGDVICPGLHRKRRERSTQCVARGEHRVVAIHLQRFVIPGNRQHSGLRNRVYRAAGSQSVEIRIGVVDHRSIGEDVDVAYLIGHNQLLRRSWATRLLGDRLTVGWAYA